MLTTLEYAKHVQLELYQINQRRYPCENGCLRCSGNHPTPYFDDFLEYQNSTGCEPILCDENEYVSDNQCVACPPGTYNAPGDDASKIEYNNLCRASNPSIWWEAGGIVLCQIITIMLYIIVNHIS